MWRVSLATLARAVAVVAEVSFPDRTLGMYVLVADDKDKSARGVTVGVACTLILLLTVLALMIAKLCGRSANTNAIPAPGPINALVKHSVVGTVVDVQPTSEADARIVMKYVITGLEDQGNAALLNPDKQRFAGWVRARAFCYFGREPAEFASS